jgi:gamma-glutamylcyclotransferase (GGCT)/AIG2-like uncharacterized protein YtfP
VFASNIPIFVYGSLMVPDVLHDVLRIEPDSELIPQYECAILNEYSRYKVIGAIFPAIVPRSGGSVSGRLIHLRVASQTAALDHMPSRVTFSVEPSAAAEAMNKKLMLPDPVLIAIRAVCARVANLSGAAEQADRILRDLEDITVLADDGSMAELLSSRLSTPIC